MAVASHLYSSQRYDNNQRRSRPRISATVMARTSWFLAPRAPNFDCSPNGHLKLGSVISKPLQPDRPIVSGLPPDLPEDVHKERAWKTSWKDVSRNRSKGNVGLWFKFLQYIRVLDAGVDWNAAEMNAYNFTKLEIEWFVPPKSLLKDRMEDEEVKNYCGTGSFRPNVYMITAVMIARHPVVKWTEDNRWTWHTEAGADLIPAGAPGASLGAKAAQETNREHEVSADSSSDFVFAYRLSKISYARKSWLKSEMIHKEKPYDAGATFSEGSSKPDDVSYAVDLDSLELSDVTAEVLDVEAELLDNDFDGEMAECILPD